MRDNMHLPCSFQSIHSHVLRDQLTGNTDFGPGSTVMQTHTQSQASCHSCSALAILG